MVLTPQDLQKQAEERARKVFHGSTCVRNYSNSVMGEFKDADGFPYRVNSRGEIRRSFIRLSKKQRRALKAKQDAQQHAYYAALQYDEHAST